MEKESDEVSTIFLLVQELAQQISKGQEEMMKVQHLTQELSNNYDELSSNKGALKQSEMNGELLLEQSEMDEESLLIQKLEQDRLSLIMDLQRQEYIQEKLIDIIDQNQETVDTVKDYLETKDQIRQEERNHAAKIFKYYELNTLQPTIENLKSMTTDLDFDVARIQHVVQVLVENTELSLEQLQGDHYRQNLLNFIKGINDIYNSYS